LSSRFAPRWYWILITAAVVPMFIGLGLWQWHRGEHRREQWDSFARGDVPAVEATAVNLARLPQFERVRISGEFDAQHQFLLDNVSHDGAPGYDVLTALRLVDGSHLLVDRGWVPFTGYRDRLPAVTLDAASAPTVVTGRLSVLPVAGLAAGRVAPPLDGPWPRVASFPQTEQLAAAYGAPLQPVLLLLDADSGPGYVRDWRPPGMSPERHFSYAIQWWSFAVLAIAMFIGLNLKKHHV
jgi:cytochrome oxidase assembly protein ShyY1